MKCVCMWVMEVQRQAKLFDVQKVQLVVDMREVFAELPLECHPNQKNCCSCFLQVEIAKCFRQQRCYHALL